MSECPIGATGGQTPPKWFPTGRLFAQTPSTIPLKSRRADVEASGLIVRRKGVDMLPVASSVKGRKVRIRAEVQLPNRYPVPLQVTMVQKQVTEPFSHTILLH